MNFSFTICDVDFVAEYDAKITLRPHPGHAPSLSDPGEPPTAGEFEATVIDLTRDEPNAPSLDLPDWLRLIIEGEIEQDEHAYNEVFE